MWKFFILGVYSISYVYAQHHFSLFNKTSSTVQLPFEGIFEGDVILEPEYRAVTNRYVVEVSSINNKDVLPFRVLVSLPRFPKYLPGDTLVVRGEIDDPGVFTLPSGSVFDYKKYLRQEKIVGVSYFGSVESVIQGKSSIRRVSFVLKEKLNAIIDTQVTYPESAMVQGMLFGSQSDFPAELKDSLITTGLIHIVVLSGFNMTIVATAILFAMNRLPRKLKVICTIIVLCLFAVFAGGTAPAWRAACMASISLVAYMEGQEYSALRALGIVILVFSFTNPFMVVYDASFHLSVLATLGLIVGTPIVERLHFLRRLPPWLRTTISATLSTQVVVLPYLLALTQTLLIIGFFANILIVPLVSVTMALGGITVLVHMIPFLNTVSGLIVSCWLRVQLYIVDVLAKIPFASLKMEFISWKISIILYVLVVILYISLRRRLKT